MHLVARSNAKIQTDVIMKQFVRIKLPFNCFNYQSFHTSDSTGFNEIHDKVSEKILLETVNMQKSRVQYGIKQIAKFC